MDPCKRAKPKSASKGITVVELKKPMETSHQSGPALKPIIGGSIKFPAPKNEAKMAKPSTKVSLILFIYKGFDKYNVN
jgi:hypothetical protein